jgi:hypothetical protein
MKFKVGDRVRHVASGKEYRVNEVPSFYYLLEECGKPFYAYTEVNGKVTYYRRQDEMEDGRFELVPN